MNFNPPFYSRVARQPSSTTSSTVVELSGPPRRLASAIKSLQISSGDLSWARCSPISESRISRVTPSVQIR